MIVGFWCVASLLVLVALFLVAKPLLSKSESASAPQLRLFITIAIAVPAVVLPLYLHWGDSQGLEQAQQAKQHAAQIRQAMAQFKNPQQVIDRIKQRLEKEPTSTKGWYLLGRLYYTSTKYAEASAAFAKANSLKPNDPKIMLQYAHALYFSEGQTLSAHAQQLIQAVLKQQKNNPEAINLLAIAAYHAGNYQTAINYWRQLLPLFAPQSQDAKVLTEAINTALKKKHKS